MLQQSVTRALLPSHESACKQAGRRARRKSRPHGSRSRWRKRLSKLCLPAHSPDPVSWTEEHFRAAREAAGPPHVRPLTQTRLCPPQSGTPLLHAPMEASTGDHGAVLTAASSLQVCTWRHSEQSRAVTFFLPQPGSFVVVVGFNLTESLMKRGYEDRAQHRMCVAMIIQSSTMKGFHFSLCLSDINWLGRE